MHNNQEITLNGVGREKGKSLLIMHRVAAGNQKVSTQRSGLRL